MSYKKKEIECWTPEMMYEGKSVLYVTELHVEPNASFMLLKNDDPEVRAKRVKDYLAIKYCPAYFGMCLKGKTKKDETCDSSVCWAKSYNEYYMKECKGDLKSYDNLIKDTITPAMCYECGYDDLELIWSDEVVKTRKYGQIIFDNVAYVVCPRCGAKYMSHQDKITIEIIKRALDTEWVVNELRREYKIVQIDKIDLSKKDKVGQQLFFETVIGNLEKNNFDLIQGLADTILMDADTAMHLFILSYFRLDEKYMADIEEEFSEEFEENEELDLSGDPNDNENNYNGWVPEDDLPV
ncbi:hypothetical protein [Caldicellulosiruptor morganii]|uniref:CpXC domain-containing protein n=1 Tax=Caldicellulosiruptor morganii TaxID=1387555 RepID=A0ABY7BRZ4_9FIRM|nr:hypothetical protein [Caldicellulosiruptor morganii]WAM33916.1 hypothetical protein OTK00_000056 [Caldicellulosiruptor morganii]